MADRDENDLQALFDAAQAHGDIEGSETEVGDLQDALRTAYELLTPEQREEFFASRAAVFLVEHEFETDDAEESQDDDDLVPVKSDPVDPKQSHLSYREYVALYKRIAPKFHVVISVMAGNPAMTFGIHPDNADGVDRNKLASLPMACSVYQMLNLLKELEVSIPAWENMVNTPDLGDCGFPAKRWRVRTI